MSFTTLALAKEHLQISHSQQDNVLQTYIDAAEDFLARYLQCDFSSAQWSENLDGGSVFLLPRHKPLTSLVSITDRFTGTVYFSQTSPAVAHAAIEGQTRICWVNDNSRPLGRWPQGIGRYSVVYTAGLATMPATVQMAVLQLVARAYEQRAGEQSESIAHATIQWGNWLQSDILQALGPYSFRRIVDVAPDQDGFGLTCSRTIY